MEANNNSTDYSLLETDTYSSVGKYIGPYLFAKGSSGKWVHQLDINFLKEILTILKEYDRSLIFADPCNDG